MALLAGSASSVRMLPVVAGALELVDHPDDERVVRPQAQLGAGR